MLNIGPQIDVHLIDSHQEMTYGELGIVASIYWERVWKKIGGGHHLAQVRRRLGRKSISIMHAVWAWRRAINKSKILCQLHNRSIALRIWGPKLIWRASLKLEGDRKRWACYIEISKEQENNRGNIIEHDCVHRMIITRRHGRPCCNGHHHVLLFGESQAARRLICIISGNAWEPVFMLSAAIGVISAREEENEMVYGWHEAWRLIVCGGDTSNGHNALWSERSGNEPGEAAPFNSNRARVRSNGKHGEIGDKTRGVENWRDGGRARLMPMSWNGAVGE